MPLLIVVSDIADFFLRFEILLSSLWAVNYKILIFVIFSSKYLKLNLPPVSHRKRFLFTPIPQKTQSIDFCRVVNTLF